MKKASFISHTSTYAVHHYCITHSWILNCKLATTCAT